MINVAVNNNLFSCLISTCKQTDKMKNQVCDLTVESVLGLLQSQKSKCCYCGHVLDIEKGDKKLSQVSIDRSDSNLGHTIENSVLSCLFCGLGKNATNVDWFRDFISVIKSDQYDAMITKYQDEKKDVNIVANLRSRAWHSDNDNRDPGDKIQVISVNEIRELAREQNNVCAITGIPFINTKLDKFPFKMSLDRIDNTGTHTKDNCQLVCLAIQYGRNDKSIQEVKDYIDEIRANTT
ncbi:hypothetical protein YASMINEVIRUS_1531 [Yasminevirus sp. GU-2018]|uniref:HNH endonuclease n=1 Tax=Yasminevirus sp. GU-2018 TaxID=2420051 RepID=A0A5K0UA77_9VIRU|nr:hypothetical protein YASMINEVIRUS_1531 [Yasminevirus sp. GU-2018]